jgi:peptide/nickel transport system substrate-binding protein
MIRQNLNRPIGRRNLLRGAGAAAVAAAASPVLPWPAWAAGETLRAGIAGYNVINTLDPGKASLIPESYVIWGLFNALLKFNEKMEVVPDLAESYAPIDATTLEFTLRRGVKFHDGGECAADDVKFTLERLLDEKFGAPNRSKVTSIGDIAILDPHTLRIKTKEPFAPLLTYLCNVRTGTQIVSRKAVAALGEEEFGRRPVGTGAFKVVDWKPNESVQLAAHADYFGGKPHLAAVTLPLIAEESSGVTALLGGQIDLASTAPFADVPSLEKRQDVRVLKQAGLNTRFISLNHRKPPFDDPHFRRALSMAFDRDAMVKAVLFGEGVPAYGLIPPSLAYAYSGKKHDVTTFNPQRAKEELAKSKYKAGTEAAVLTWGASWWKRIAEVFTGMANQTLGTKLTVEVSEANTVYQRLRAGDFQASVWGWLGFVDADEYLGENLDSKGWRNFMGYNNPKVDEMLEAGRRELDHAKRGEIYKAVEALMIEDMPLIPCFVSNIHNLMTPKVQGFVQLPYSNFADQFGNIRLG